MITEAPDYDGSVPLKSAKQERFAQNCLDMSFSDARRAAFDCSRETDKTVWEEASRLASNPKVAARINFLKAQTASAKVMSVQERKEVLSELGRRNPADYIQAGKDGGWITYGPDSKNPRAVSGIETSTKTVTSEKGTLSETTLITKLKILEPVSAIAELNKMEGVYPAQKQETEGWLTIINDLPRPGGNSAKKKGKRKTS